MQIIDPHLPFRDGVLCSAVDSLAHEAPVNNPTSGGIALWRRNLVAAARLALPAQPLEPRVPVSRKTPLRSSGAALRAWLLYYGNVRTD